ncbi:hypothetical protein LCC91_03300 [Tepidimonas taiwanensis]|uniref:Polysaccharide deacetylase n=1 Tax=Tepidimonas taiwanensis TaxID=307486 RepID=A0A554X679_9BURK|nr:hypothetical protein [Tepidimonas taiwanensis]TSE31339.1 hypothetical protein Ttaiw_01513 [Tepidimonas taiwanensis]UBQ06144.1 hypothetical protein LCC91_03300 [Tepidimonas taiwanensis]
MTRSAKISEIKPDDPSAWEDRLFLTIDIDWVHDTVLADMIDLLDRFDVHATWFVTHDTPLLERLRDNPRYELGIHPKEVLNNPVSGTSMGQDGLRLST